jgi:hypothetical protein
MSNGHPHGNGIAHGKDGMTKGVRTGPHWFEVVPQNKVQNDLIKLSLE